MKNKIWFQNLPLLLLAAAIAFSPEWSLGTIAGGRNVVIRIEDVLLVVFGIVWITNFLISRRKKIEKPPLFFPILIWLGIGFFSLLINLIFANLTFSRGFFYFLKEVEFFILYFYVFYHLKKPDSIEIILKIWIILGGINVLLIFQQLLRGIKYGVYGPSLYKEMGALPSGGFFLILFIFLFNFLLYYFPHWEISRLQKNIFRLIVLSLPIGVIFSGSRTAIFGLILAVLLSVFFYQFKKGDLKIVFNILIIFLIIFTFLYYFGSKTRDISGLFFSKAFYSLVARARIWQDQLSFFSDRPFFILLGMGKSVLLIGEESHSQYIRNFIETGIVGSLIFLFMIFSIIKKSLKGLLIKKEFFLNSLSAGLLISTLSMLFLSIAAEAFLVVRIVEVYWFFTAITMAVLNFGKINLNKKFLSH